MKKYLFFQIILLCFTLTTSSELMAQADMITFPVEGTVFQKDNNNEHQLFFAGQTNASITQDVYYKIFKRNSNGTHSLVVSETQINPTWTSSNRKGFYVSAGKFSKGWYWIWIVRKLPLINNTYVYVPMSFREIGVGDVYFVAGQSNASGYNEPDDTTIPYYNDPTNNRMARVYSKSEFHNGSSPNVNEMNNINSGIPYPTPANKKSFEVFRNGTSQSDLVPIFPNGRASWVWAPLAHRIANEKGTPVVFFNVAYQGSSLRWNWAQDENGSNLNQKMSKTLLMFGNVLGAKAVLWHQGETDNDNLGNPSYQYPIGEHSTGLNNLINWSRKPLKDDSKKLSWYVSEVSYMVGTNGWTWNNHDGPHALSPMPISGYGITSKYFHEGLKQQQRNVKNNSSRIFKGIETDVNQENERDTWQRVHFTGNSLLTIANKWYSAIYDNYQNDGVLPTQLIQLTNVVDNGNNSYTLTVTDQGPGATYYWVKNDAGIRGAVVTTSNTYPFSGTAPDNFLSCYVLKNSRLSACQPFVVPGGQFQSKSIAVSSESLSYTGNASTQEVAVSSQNVQWQVGSVPSWVNYSYNEMEGKLSISTTANNTGGARSGAFVLEEIGGGVSKTINLHQNVSGSSTISFLTLSPTSGSYNTNLSNDQNTMQIGGVQYFQGLGVHADRTITYNLSGQYSTFFGKAGRDDEADNPYDSGKVQFTIKGDGATLWTSQVHGNNTNAEAFNINVSGKNNLELIVDHLEDYSFDHADWVDLYLTTGGGGGCSTPPNPSNVSASSSTINSGQSTTLYASCSVGTITWSTGQTGSSISVTPSSSTTYQVSCVNGSCQSGTVPVSITVNSGGGGPCAAISDNLVMGTWTITGQPLVARYFHGQYWLTQRVSTSPDEFVVRGAAMLQRSDVSLNNSSYYNLINCFSWIYSDYGNLQVPNSSTFPTPSGYTLVYSQDGTPYYSGSSAPPNGIVSGNCYKIKSLANNYYLQAMSGGDIQINTNNNQNDQKWKLESVGTSYKITTMNGSGNVIKANSLNYSTWLALGSFVSGNNLYYWNFENNSGNYRISAPSNQHTWDHEGAGSNNHLQIYGNTAEQFMDYRLFAFEGTTCPAGLRVGVTSSEMQESEKADFMNFSPNPMHGNVEVSVNILEEGPVEISITDFQGRELDLKTFEGKKGMNSFDYKAGRLSTGTYLLRVKSKGKLESKKVVVE